MSGSRKTALLMLWVATFAGRMSGARGEEPAAGAPEAYPPPGLNAAPGPYPFQPPPAEPVDPPVPTVSLRVRVPAVAAPNAELQYRILVENSSRASAHHVVVRNPLSANVQYVRATPEPSEQKPELRWQFGTLEPLARKEIVLVVKATGAEDIRNTARVQFEFGQSVTTKISAPGSPAVKPEAGPLDAQPGKSELRIRLTGPSQSLVELGPVIDFRTTVTNVGTAAAKGVILTNKFPAGLDFSNSKPSVSGDKMGVVTWELGDLPPGKTTSVVCTVIPKVVGKYAIRAEVRDAAGAAGEAMINVAVGEPKLSIVTTGPKLRLVNRPTPYLTTVSNTGTMPLTNVIVTSEVTEGMTLKSATGGAFISKEQVRADARLMRNVKYQEVRWWLGTLAPGERRSLQMVLQTSNPGLLDHRVRATADRNLEQMSDAKTEFEEATGLTHEIDASANVIEVGGKMSYTIRVVNQGGAPAKNIGLTVDVPEQMVIEKNKLDKTARVEGQKVIFTLLALAKETSADFVVPVQAQKAGQARLSLELTADLLVAGPIKDAISTTIVEDAPAK